jgi:hypothetical protein
LNSVLVELLSSSFAWVGLFWWSLLPKNFILILYFFQIPFYFRSFATYCALLEASYYHVFLLTSCYPPLKYFYPMGQFPLSLSLDDLHGKWLSSTDMY